MLAAIAALFVFIVYDLTKQLFSKTKMQSATLVSKTRDNYVTQQVFLQGREVHETHVQIGSNRVLHFDLEDGTRLHLITDKDTYAHFTEGAIGTLTYKGTKFLKFDTKDIADTYNDDKTVKGFISIADNF